MTGIEIGKLVKFSRQYSWVIVSKKPFKTRPWRFATPTVGVLIKKPMEYKDLAPGLWFELLVGDVRVLVQEQDMIQFSYE